MARRSSRLVYAVLMTLLFVAAYAEAQQQQTPALTPTARLTAAKTAFVKNAGGTRIPYNVISSAMEGWGRFALVETPEQADLIVEISAPPEGNGVSMTSGTTTSSKTGMPEQSTSTTKTLSSSEVRLVVLDGKNRVPLWSGTEKPKFAMKQKAKEDNLVEAAQRLFTRFRERMETVK